MEKNSHLDSEGNVELKGLAFWLRNNPNDEWLKIIKETRIEHLTHKSGLREWVGNFTRLNECYQYEPAAELSEPIEPAQIQEFIKIEDYSVGNAEWPEIVRIDHLKPLRYLRNLRELCICNNTVSSLEPIWWHFRLERLWIEDTNIPEAEVERFSIDHPKCRVELKVYL